MKYHYSWCELTDFVSSNVGVTTLFLACNWLFTVGGRRERPSLVGSLAGAAHLLNDNTGVLRGAQWEQKSHVEQKGKSSFDFDFQYEYKLWKHGLSIL